MKRIDDDVNEEVVSPAPDEPPALEPPTASRASGVTHVEIQRTSPPLIRWIVAAVIIVILTLLILVLARWIYHKSHHTIKPTPAASQQSAQTSSLNTQSSTNLQGSSNGSNSGSSNTGATGSNAGSKSTSPSNNTGTLPNNGPGNVAGIFIISAGAAGGLHYVIRSRRYDS